MTVASEGRSVTSPSCSAGAGTRRRAVRGRDELPDAKLDRPPAVLP